MTTTPAMPELPEPFALSVSVHEGDTPAKTYVECMLYQKHPNEKQHLYTADQMRAYALATLQAQPAEVSDEEWWHEVLGSAGPDLLGLAKEWDANEVHVYQFVNEAEKIVKAAAQRAILALRPQSESEARRAAQEQLYAERERHTAEVKRLQAEIGRLQSLRPQYSSPAAEPVGRAVEVGGEIRLIPYDDDPATSPLSDGGEVFCAPLNLNCKSVQKRLMAQWGYEAHHGITAPAGVEG